MSIDIAELKDAAHKAFGQDGLKPLRETSWPNLVEMGWLLMPVPEEAGGLGLGRDAVVALALELGRVLSPLALPGALIAVRGLSLAQNFAQRDDLIGKIAQGGFMTAPLEFSGPTLLKQGEQYYLDGTLRAVQDADMASHVGVISDGAGLCSLIPLDAKGVSVHESVMWDESRRLFDISLTRYEVDPALLLADDKESVKPLATAMKIDLMIALAADSIGGAHAALDMSVEYLKTRKQFDRPLAMFQALKHRCANLATDIAASEALLWTLARKAEPSLQEAYALKAHATQLYCDVAEEAIQLHGGIGLTEEYDCHHFLKRAMLNRVLGGNNDDWLEFTGRKKLEQLSAG